MFKKIRFVSVAVLAFAVLVFGGPAGSPSALNKTQAATFIVTVPGKGAGAQGKVIIVTLGNDNAAQHAGQNSNFTPQPILSVSPTTPITMNAVEGINPADPQFTISNPGPANSVLNWAAVGSAPWIGLSQASGTLVAGASINLVVGANVSGLTTAGSPYSGTISISDPLASNSPQTIAVTLNVFPKPAIGLSSASMTFSATQSGANPAGQTLAITNNGPVNSKLNWSATNAQPWLVLSLNSGSLASGASANATVNANISGLAPGTYTDTILVSDPTASNNPQTVNMTLNVISSVPPPVIEQLNHGVGVGTAVNLGGRQLIVIPTAMTISAVGMWLTPDGGAFNHSDSHLAIFSDNGGAPGNQVAASDILSISDSSPAGEELYNFSAPAVLSSGSYWLEPMFDGGNSTEIGGSIGNPYTDGYWFWPPNPSFSSIEDAYFRIVAQ